MTSPGPSFELDAGPPGAVYLLLEDTRARSGPLQQWLEEILPAINWRSHLYFVGLDHAVGPADWDPLARAASRHVRAAGFATVYLHPVVHLRAGEPPELALLERVIAPARAYQVMAYQEQGEAQLLVLPIIATADVPASDVEQVAAFLRARFAEPSFIFDHRLPTGLEPGHDGVGFRAYIDTGEGHGAGPAGKLWVNHLLETLLERLQQPGADLLAPCQRHLVVDERAGQVYPCFWAWRAGQHMASMEATAPPSAHRVPRSQCPRCMADAAEALWDDLEANGRQREGRQIYFQLALALAEQKEHALAVSMAYRARQMTDRDPDRAAALIHAGLCHLDLGELEQADRDLQEADMFTDDHAHVAFLRGRVQFAWRDYIEALERFEEALQPGAERLEEKKAGSPRVPLADMFYEMALCHINIEEYADARGYLLRHGGAAASPVISFYLGICDHGEGRMEPAMAHFQQALRLEPSPEDLGRVLFYVGACLKELSRFEEAIEVLERAVDADPNDIVNHNLLGFCHYKVGRHAEAVACFRRCVEIDPGSGIDWANLGSNLRDLGRVPEALAMYKKAVSLDRHIGFARDNIQKLEGVSEPEDP